MKRLPWVQLVKVIVLNLYTSNQRGHTLAVVQHLLCVLGEEECQAARFAAPTLCNGSISMQRDALKRIVLAYLT